LTGVAARPPRTEMDFDSVTATTLFDIFLLLLIGIGPKLVPVPFLHATAETPLVTKHLVLRGEGEDPARMRNS
jgi:hypothetical protein